jgi:hypothetical protein
MAAKKNPIPEKNPREVYAQACGTVSGMFDHIARFKQEIADVDGRCTNFLEFTKDVPVEFLTEKDRQFILELQTFLRTRWGDLHTLQTRVTEITTRLNKYRP